MKPKSPNNPDLSVILLHDDMVDKNGRIVTTSLTLIDLHDIARTSRTYGVKTAFIAHSSPTIRNLGGRMRAHWETGYGLTYNPNRKDALEVVDIVCNLDEATEKIKARTGKEPCLVATSARPLPNRVSFKTLRHELLPTNDPFLIMFGTGWGMSSNLLAKANYFLEPLPGVGEYNHLSVRAAVAIIVDRLLGEV